MTRALIAVRTRLVSTDRESGATAVEYGLMVSLIAVAIIVAVGLLGGRLDTIFRDITSKI